MKRVFSRRFSLSYSQPYFCFLFLLVRKRKSKPTETLPISSGELRHLRRVKYQLWRLRLPIRRRLALLSRCCWAMQVFETSIGETLNIKLSQAVSSDSTVTVSDEFAVVDLDSDDTMTCSLAGKRATITGVRFYRDGAVYGYNVVSGI